MKTKIYYFSGTGNTKFFASKVAENLRGTELIPIQDVINLSVELNESVGIFYPVYVWGLPEIVIRFIEKNDFSKASYVFVGATGGGSAGPSIKQAGKLIEKSGGQMNYGFFSKLPGNATNIYNAMNEEKCTELRAESLKKAKKVAANISNKIQEIEKFHPIFILLHKLMYGGFLKGIPSIDKNFIVTSNCNECGICEKVCPMGNISMQNNKPVYGGNCQSCFACYNRCPQVAITVKGDKMKRRYDFDINS